ncbi:LOW QUALITY PROTEIN: hypothetical protein BC938DRAFT_471520 [Jimgerdemannia flammicorona]|uniref:Uncharacterized protein n=1 Tax=Jimgerdemannia flammicorona TaxID=994334 RepID=A0A433QUJ4_9FUNG|nr:LOW QUALITY PROTEIN: hypothetical protein BC938DRAFT_471520 [Jimgerdemannia flammicorona]
MGGSPPTLRQLRRLLWRDDWQEPCIRNLARVRSEDAIYLLPDLELFRGEADRDEGRTEVCVATPNGRKEAAGNIAEEAWVAIYVSISKSTSASTLEELQGNEALTSDNGDPIATLLYHRGHPLREIIIVEGEILINNVLQAYEFGVDMLKKEINFQDPRPPQKKVSSAESNNQPATKPSNPNRPRTRSLSTAATILQLSFSPTPMIMSLDRGDTSSIISAASRNDRSFQQSVSISRSVSRRISGFAMCSRAAARWSFVMSCTIDWYSFDPGLRASSAARRRRCVVPVAFVSPLRAEQTTTTRCCDM